MRPYKKIGLKKDKKEKRNTEYILGDQIFRKEKKK